ncbi:hypothetical protein EVAR_60965_1 [Eumeta japonica]|uniref:Uncharacterized protein n=1 Tax=Eumeta variegata TaxID=151549 RepID=A0A4C1XTQ9_EUMVA|nr:hypothetical protein EVAR_60965_1 [Eumeta japonica]
MKRHERRKARHVRRGGIPGKGLQRLPPPIRAGVMNGPRIMHDMKYLINTRPPETIVADISRIWTPSLRFEYWNSADDLVRNLYERSDPSIERFEGGRYHRRRNAYSVEKDICILRCRPQFVYARRVERHALLKALSFAS